MSHSCTLNTSSFTR